MTIEPGTRLAQLCGAGGLAVNSFHHQAVDVLGQGLRAVAHADDGTIEAIEAPGSRFVLGVQWHAEGLVGTTCQRALFEALVDAAGTPPLRRAA